MSTKFLSNITETVPQVTGTVIRTDWNEVMLVLVGAIIGWLLSLATIVVQRHMDQKGKLYIFYKFKVQKDTGGHGWGFEKDRDGNLCLTIPVAFELQNTSNATRVIRDVSLLLYRDNQLIGKMTQINYMQNITRTNGVAIKGSEYHYGTEKGSYSFVLDPRSIQRQECHYTYKIAPSEKADKSFNRLVVRYYDEKNKAHLFQAKDISNSWDIKLFNPDEEWILLNPMRTR